MKKPLILCVLFIITFIYCQEARISGCTDPEAMNYCPECTEDDGSCIYGMLGDVDQNESIDIIDIVMIVGFIFELTIPDEYQNCSSDWTEDGVIDIMDIVGIVDCALNDCWEDVPVTDIDGNAYSTVAIGDQVWMAENLKTTHYNNGDPIPTGYANPEWAGLSTGAYAVYNDDPQLFEIYGSLYNWHAVDDARDICPEGFHVPSDEEWTILTDYLGGTNIAGGALKEAGLDHWLSPNTGATNSSGFTALPGGYRRYTDGSYLNLHYYGYFWTSSLGINDEAWGRKMVSSSSGISRTRHNKLNGYSVRCIGD